LLIFSWDSRANISKIKAEKEGKKRGKEGPGTHL
jgi:hypothetical protein